MKSDPRIAFGSGRDRVELPQVYDLSETREASPRYHRLLAAG